MTKSADITNVTCGNCGHEQKESSAVISTICTQCQAYIAVGLAAAAKSHRAPRRSRMIVCPHCEKPQRVYPDALTMMCTDCGAHVNMSNHLISGKFQHSLSTFGEVTFAKGCHYSGGEVCAQVIHASGELRTRLKAYGDLNFRHRTVVKGPITAENIYVHVGAQVHARRVTGSVIEIKGYLAADSLVASSRLVVEEGGYLSAKLIKAPDIEVRRGGGAEGDFESIPLAATF